jgi:soluble lytic murein transglycosylase
VARERNAAQHDMRMHQAIDRWKMLTGNSQMSFDSYAGFLLSYPDFPQEATLRGYAEAALERESPAPRVVTSFFERYPPLTNRGKAHYALSLAAMNAPGARDRAVEAWRGGPMSEANESAILYNYGTSLTPADHDARMNALLWEGEIGAAQHQIGRVSPASRSLFMERLNIRQGNAPNSLGAPLGPDADRDPGYTYDKAQYWRRTGNIGGSIRMLASRPPSSRPVFDAELWVKELLLAAKGAGSDQAVQIAASIDDAFEPGTDVSDLSFRLRDDYTSLMWLGGTKALWTLRQPLRAAPLFYRYGAAAKTPATRSKGFYWAGRASAQANDMAAANRYFEMAADYPDHFYGQLSLERLGRPIPNLATMPTEMPTRDERAAFEAQPLTHAVREVARDFDWRTTVRFFRQIAEEAQTEAEYVMVIDLAREIGRRDLAVIAGSSAHTAGHKNFHMLGFPQIPTPPGANWTMVHAITRQESQFAENAISHAGARGLMQLMPGTAREQAGKLGLSYRPSDLINNPTYNIQLGNGYFARMMDYYGGSFPLAVGAYNAGPGNVNKFLRANGDPRTGSIDWIEWIERIPIYETKNYIQKVLENAVTYEHLYPEKTYRRGDQPLSRFLGKRTPG